MPEPMKCPYREKDGEFCDCYGAACMAYCEYVPPPLPVRQVCACAEEQKPIRICRRISAYMSYPGGRT